MGVPFTAGGLTAAQARQLNELMRTMEQFARLTVAAPLNLSRASGIPIISAPTLAGFKSSWKEPVRVATTAAGTLASSFENGDTVDGVVLKTNDRILIKDQAAQTANGIYVVNPSGAPTRAADCDTGEELLCAVVMVSEGTANKDTVWGQTADATIVVGTTNIVWIQLAPGTSLTVEEVDGSPSYTATTTLRFDQADGFVLTQPGAGIARVDQADATTSQAGKVNTSSQTFGGQKTFDHSAIAAGDGTFAAGTGIYSPTAWTVTFEAPALGDTSLTTMTPSNAPFVPSAGSHPLRPTILLTAQHLDGQILATDAPDADHGADIWVVPTRSSNNKAGRLILNGRYCVNFGIDGSSNYVIYNGIDGTKTVKDGTGTNQTVTIIGGIITGWT